MTFFLVSCQGYENDLHVRAVDRLMGLGLTKIACSLSSHIALELEWLKTRIMATDVRGLSLVAASWRKSISVVLHTITVIDCIQQDFLRI
jgi:hypothetical protein